MGFKSVLSDYREYPATLRRLIADEEEERRYRDQWRKGARSYDALAGRASLERDRQRAQQDEALMLDIGVDVVRTLLSPVSSY